MLRHNDTKAGFSIKKPGLLAYLPGLIMLIAITILLLMPSSDLPSNPFFELIYLDKWVHIGLLALLTMIWGFPGIHYFDRSQRHLLFIAVIFVLYGVVTEYAQQHLTPDRSFDPIDMLADTIGVVTGYCILRYYRNKILTKKTSN